MVDRHVWQHVSLAVRIISQMITGIFFKMIQGLIVQISMLQRVRNIYFVLTLMMIVIIPKYTKKLEMIYYNFALLKEFILFWLQIPSNSFLSSFVFILSKKKLLVISHSKICRFYVYKLLFVLSMLS
jgi:hypothetical protein